MLRVYATANESMMLTNGHALGILPSYFFLLFAFIFTTFIGFIYHVGHIEKCVCISMCLLTLTGISCLLFVFVFLIIAMYIFISSIHITHIQTHAATLLYLCACEE